MRWTSLKTKTTPNKEDWEGRTRRNNPNISGLSPLQTAEYIKMREAAYEWCRRKKLEALGDRPDHTEDG